MLTEYKILYIFFIFLCEIDFSTGTKCGVCDVSNNELRCINWRSRPDKIIYQAISCIKYHKDIKTAILKIRTTDAEPLNEQNMKPFKKIQNLHLDNSDLGNIARDSFKSLKRLKFLSLRNTNVRWELIQDLLAFSPHLKGIYLAKLSKECCCEWLNLQKYLISKNITILDEKDEIPICSLQEKDNCQYTDTPKTNSIIRSVNIETNKEIGRPRDLLHQTIEFNLPSSIIFILIIFTFFVFIGALVICLFMYYNFKRQKSDCIWWPLKNIFSKSREKLIKTKYSIETDNDKSNSNIQPTKIDNERFLQNQQKKLLQTESELFKCREKLRKFESKFGMINDHQVIDRNLTQNEIEEFFDCMKNFNENDKTLFLNWLKKIPKSDCIDCVRNQLNLFRNGQLILDYRDDQSMCTNIPMNSVKNTLLGNNGIVDNNRIPDTSRENEINNYANNLKFFSETNQFEKEHNSHVKNISYPKIKADPIYENTQQTKTQNHQSVHPEFDRKFSTSKSDKTNSDTLRKKLPYNRKYKRMKFHINKEKNTNNPDSDDDEYIPDNLKFTNEKLLYNCNQNQSTNILKNNREFKDNSNKLKTLSDISSLPDN